MLLTPPYTQSEKMMRAKEKVLDDLAQVAGGTINVLSGFTQNIREDIKARINETADRLDWVPREDFERLEMRVAALEKTLEDLSKAQKKP